MALILRIAFLFKHSTQSAEVGYTFDGAYSFKLLTQFSLFPHAADGSHVNYQKAASACSDDWRAMVARSGRALSFSASTHVDHRGRPATHLLISLLSDQHILSASLYLCLSHTLFPVYSPCLGSSINHSHSELHEPQMFKGPFVPLRVGAMWISSQIR